MKLLPLIVSIFLLWFTASCSNESVNSDKENDDDQDVPFKVKTLSINHTDLQLIEKEAVDFIVTAQPTPDGNEYLVWRFIGPDTLVIIDPALEVNYQRQMRFKEGNYTLSLAIYKTGEYTSDGMGSPNHGSLNFNFSVRKATVKIEAVAGQPRQQIIFTANSPQQSRLRNPEYWWDFGDDESKRVTDSNSVVHTYTIGGEYTVITNLWCDLSIEDKLKTLVAADTLTIEILPDLTKELTITISPQDTTWNTTSGLTLYAETNLNQIDYPDKIKWVIDYGDGESDEDESYLNNRYISHRYYNNGDYILDVVIYNLDTKELLAQDSAVIHINNLQFITQTNYLYASIEGYSVRHFGTLGTDGTFTQQSENPGYYDFGGSVNNPLEWRDNGFSTQHIYTIGLQTYTYTLTGTVSPDGNKVERLEHSFEYINPDYNGKEWTRLTRFVLENVPLTIYSTYRYSHYESGSKIGQYVTAFEDWNKIYNPKDGTADYNYMDDLDWKNNSRGEPEITIEFEKR